MEATGVNRQAKFWSRVHLQAEGCWLWDKTHSAKQYPKFRWDGKLQSVHRISWQIEHGPIPKGIDVLHHCDNRACTRPDHLFLGTDSENMRDMVSKGRQNYLYGEFHPNSVLNEDQVLEIRRLYATGRYTQEELAKQFGVYRKTISKVVNLLTWRRRNLDKSGLV